MSKTYNEIRRYPLQDNEELIKQAMKWCHLSGKYSAFMSVIKGLYARKSKRMMEYEEASKGYLEVKQMIADEVRKITGSENSFVLSTKLSAFIEFDIKFVDVKDTNNIVHYDEAADFYTVEVGDDVRKVYEVNDDVMEDIENDEHTEKGNV